ncbi:MAG: hypothetical protein VB049_05015 [Candidatus Pelethousia sp.]|nr:hypothetical protein [Candidatus Pelethousia sp.]
MATLSFETGIKTFDINGDPERVISFNPTDLNFIHRLYEAFRRIDALHKGYQIKADKLTDPEKVLKVLHQADGEIRKLLDETFLDAVSDKVFGGQSTYAITSDGVPLWMGFLVAVMAQCDESYTERETAKSPKLEALLAKYKA